MVVDLFGKSECKRVNTDYRYPVGHVLQEILTGHLVSGILRDITRKSCMQEVFTFMRA